MEKLLRNKKIKEEYLKIHDSMDMIKFLYLKIVNNYNVKSEIKDKYHSTLMSIANEFESHFKDLENKEINDLNIDDFEVNERSYNNELIKKLGTLIKDLKEDQTVKVNYAEIKKNHLDRLIENNTVSPKHSIEKKNLNKLNLYNDANNGMKINELSAEIVDIKAQNYIKKFDKDYLENGELLYRLKLRIEKLIENKEIYFYENEEIIEYEKLGLKVLDKNYRLILNEKKFKVMIELNLYEDNLFLEGGFNKDSLNLKIVVSPDNQKDVSVFLSQIEFGKIINKIDKLVREHDNYLDDEGKEKEENKRIAINLLDELI